MTLQEYMEKYGLSQTDAGIRLGLSQSLISKMISAGRDITVRKVKGRYAPFETKPLPDGVIIIARKVNGVKKLFETRQISR